MNHCVMDGVYRTLISTQHIRILTLAPSEDVDAALEGSLEQQHIEDPSKEYEAISYTWGGQERSQPLRCDATMINITPNLASALQCLRSRAAPRRLWADAICINQDDLTEKGQQIPLMARIFRSATQVRVWLGKGEEGESRAVDDLASFVKRAGPSESQHYEEKPHQALVDIGRSAQKVFKMPWFSRRWIVQEFVLNGNIVFHCGHSKLSWPALHFAVHALPTDIWDDELDVHTRRKLRTLIDLWRTWSFGNASTTTDRGIYSLLHSFADLECKEAKDRIYAIAGLADDLDLQWSRTSTRVASITPDYGMSDKEVFKDLAFKMIQSGKVFSTLAHAGASRITGGEEPLASWIPDVRNPESLPLIVTDREADIKLLEVFQLSNGSLNLKIEVYNCFSDWGPPSAPDWGPPSPRPRDRGSQPLDLNDYILDWCPSFVKDLYEGPETWVAHDGRFLLQHMDKWLNADPKSIDLYQFVTDVYDVPEKYGLSSMLWCLIRGQVLTEDGYESLARLPSIQDVRVEFLTGDLDRRWEIYLNKALSKVKFYTGQTPIHGKESETRVYGFGPRDLNSGDTIILSSGHPSGYTALFLRPAGSQYRVLGGGFAWPCSGTRSGSSMPCEIEVNLI